MIVSKFFEINSCRERESCFKRIEGYGEILGKKLDFFLSSVVDRV